MENQPQLAGPPIQKITPRPTASHRTLLAPLAFAIPLACTWLLLCAGQIETRNPIAINKQATEQHGLRLNPNKASWSDLALLPNIGKIKAKRIITHREKNRTAASPKTFQRPSDLEQVKGIGPITIEKIARHLKFD